LAVPTNVPEIDITQRSFPWTRGIAARETLRYLDRHGIDAERLLSEAGLARPQLAEEPGGILVASQHRFLELAALEANDPVLGLHVAEEIDMRDIGILFYLAAATATIAEALEYLARYAATTNEEIRLEIVRQQDETRLTFRRVFATDEPRRQYAELIALAFYRVLRRLANRDFVPLRIGFAHARDSGLRDVHRILRCPVDFMQAADTWVLPQRVMELPIVSEDRRLLRILEAHADELLEESHTAAGLPSLVEARLLSTMPSGRVQASEVAESLGMSVRSLKRRLAEEDTSFGEILDRLRHRLALTYLEDEHFALKQIAWLLGYSVPSAFNHAFKRWTGTSPSRARNRSV
jgi:AraC-like DNA-binding protein